MKDNPEVTYLEEDEVALLFENIKNKANKRMLNRDLCIMKLGFATGLRVSAIVQIDIDDVDLNNNRIKVIEKGDREHFILIGENLKNQILLWLDDRKKYFNWEATSSLFISQESKRISTRTIRDLLDKYSDGLDKHITPHMMRHTCATNLYEKTGDIYLCASQLNHKNVSTTQRYAEISKSRKAEATNILDNLI
jgi:site-specific recombinase XerD